MIIYIPSKKDTHNYLTNWHKVFAFFPKRIPHSEEQDAVIWLSHYWRKGKSPYSSGLTVDCASEINEWEYKLKGGD